MILIWMHWLVYLQWLGSKLEFSVLHFETMTAGVRDQTADHWWMTTLPLEPQPPPVSASQFNPLKTKGCMNLANLSA